MNIILKKGSKEKLPFGIVNYIEIISSSDTKYGICSMGWVLKCSESVDLVPWNTENFISLLKVLEINSTLLAERITSFSKQNGTEIVEIFPIHHILKCSFEMQSEYWSSLGIDFCFRAEYFPRELGFLQQYRSETWASQSLRHRMKKILSRIG